MRRNSRTVRPSTSAKTGVTVRSRKGLASRTRCIGWLTIRVSRALMYAAISGSSGMTDSLQFSEAILQHRDARLYAANP
jgi:hypothetical protein